jgi:hypothetical protein
MATEAQREGGLSCCDETGCTPGEGDACCDEAGGATNDNVCCSESECAPANDAACCCAPAPDPLEIIRRDRDFVLNKWQSPSGGTADADNVTPGSSERFTAAIRVPGREPEADCDCPTPSAEHVLSLDDALDWLRGNMFTISGMAFMDGSNLDAERLKRCRVQYYTPDDRLIPFCAYNTMYRDSD